MQFRGPWIGEDDHTCTGEVPAWGEWEAQSKMQVDQSRDARLPAILWGPCYDRCPTINACTTPIRLSSGSFLYSNCGTGALQDVLGRGSMIAFGSHFRATGTRHRLRCRDAPSNTCRRMCEQIGGGSSRRSSLRHRGPDRRNGKARTLKLYRGATPIRSGLRNVQFLPRDARSWRCQFQAASCESASRALRRGPDLAREGSRKQRPQSRNTPQALAVPRGSGPRRRPRPRDTC